MKTSGSGGIGPMRAKKASDSRQTARRLRKAAARSRVVSVKTSGLV